MGLRSRLITYNVFGYSSPGAYAFSFAGEDAWQRARKRTGAIKNVIALTGDGRDGAPAVCLAFTPTFTSANNAKAAWTADAGSGYFSEMPGPFEAGVKGLAYERSEAGQVGQFYSNTFQVGRNAPWCLRFYLHKPPDNATFPATVFRCGRWQLMVTKQKAEMMRLTDAWTQTQETTLLGLLGDDSITPGEQDAIDELRESIYSNVTAVNFGGELYGQAHLVTFIPEPRGVINIQTDSSDEWQTVRDADILGTRADGQLWAAGPVIVRSNGVALLWQVGKPRFAPTGSLRLGPYQTATSGDWTYTTISNAEQTGAAVSMANETIDVVFDEVVVSFETSDSSVTPFFYSGYAYRAPAVRSGYGASATFDTDDLTRNLIEEIDFSFEDLHRRMTANVRLVNTYGAATGDISSPTAYHYPALENLMCDLWVQSPVTGELVRVIKNGIVKLSGHSDVMQATDNQVVANVMGPTTRTTPMICDQWALLDEYIMEEVLPVGDGLTLGAYLRDLLQLRGLHANEYAGVSASAGRVLPQARPGETFRVQPARGTRLGDYIRKLLDLFGLGRQIWISTSGVWQFGFRSTSPVFTVTKGTRDEDAYEGLALPRDPTETYNLFRVYGAAGPNGLPLSATWTVWASIRPSTSRKYVGRVRAFPAVEDESLVTQSDVNFAVRSLKTLYSKPGHYINAVMKYRPNVFPGDYLTFHGETVEVVQLQGASIAFGSATDPAFAGQMQAVMRVVE